MSIRVIPLGAGQDVGKSCVIVSMGGKNVMFDCGMHMGFQDARRFPDFSYISRDGGFTGLLDALVISHFHLDHCGALPYFTEMCGYDGPIYMTHPTKAVCPILLEDYRHIQTDRKGEVGFFTSAMIDRCMKKVVGVSLHEVVEVAPGFTLKAYYAGHVLGAAMFEMRVGEQCVVYTGDYNMTPDRHLGAAWIERCRPDLLISESTYATTVRDSKRAREADLLKKVLACVKSGGKVLIPVFALGRAQELCILLESYWERMGLNVPIYFSTGLTSKANNYYKLFIGWTNQKLKRTFMERNMFDFRRIQPWNRSYLSHQGACVLFATPGMLNAGTALEAFQQWAPDPKNMVILPGYCVAGTVGAKVLQGDKRIRVDVANEVDVRLQVENLSFSAHADAKGIMQLIRMAEPRNVMLVHGEARKMAVLKERVEGELGIPCYYPPNGAVVVVEGAMEVPVDVAGSARCPEDGKGLGRREMVWEELLREEMRVQVEKGVAEGLRGVRPRTLGLVCGTLSLVPGGGIVQIEGDVDADVDVGKKGGEETADVEVEGGLGCAGQWRDLLFRMPFRYTVRDGCCSASNTPWREGDPVAMEERMTAMERVERALVRELGFLGEGDQVVGEGEGVRVRSVRVSEVAPGKLEVGWEYADRELGGRVLDILDVALA